MREARRDCGSEGRWQGRHSARSGSHLLAHALRLRSVLADRTAAARRCRRLKFLGRVAAEGRRSPGDAPGSGGLGGAPEEIWLGAPGRAARERGRRRTVGRRRMPRATADWPKASQVCPSQVPALQSPLRPEIGSICRAAKWHSRMAPWARRGNRLAFDLAVRRQSGVPRWARGPRLVTDGGWAQRTLRKPSQQTRSHGRSSEFDEARWTAV